ncbi:hypothetical protein N7539_008663 [Penicillium diatomitis]|uniref:Uncharacterized protein n=1 Tax=Penicillium diatomitis TaxID=2819901 RepID=A0A9W9WR71_9EURO|nr:uncharacterized protein N7539_008663 [Penicillium diatomitis]KAJ5472094.1 hypothetical protein N7539_008663 [Penicillium diatomitis]
MSCPSFQHNQPSRAESYEDWLSDFTYDICGDLAYSWIGLFEPELNYSGPRPAWWPGGVKLMNPRRLLKKVYQKTLAKILDAFQDQQTGRNVPLDKTFESREKGKSLRSHYKALKNMLQPSIIFIFIVFGMAHSRPISSATTIRQIVEVTPSSLEDLADLTSDFCVEWLSFSPQGEPLAFSIRIAVSQSHSRIVTTIARGWEDIPGIIAEIEAQYLSTMSFV